MLRAWGRGHVCLKRSGAGEACCGPGDMEARGGVEVWSSGALKVRCRHVDVEVQRHGALELWRRAAGVTR